MSDIYQSIQSFAKVDKGFTIEIDPDGFWSTTGEDGLRGSARDSIEVAAEKIVQSMDSVHSTKAKAAAVIRTMVHHFSFYDGEHDIVDVSDLFRVAERLEGRQP